MARRHERALRRLERIHAKRLLEEAEKMKKCIEHDACDMIGCDYFARPDSALELMEFVIEILEDELEMPEK